LVLERAIRFNRPVFTSFILNEYFDLGATYYLSEEAKVTIETSKNSGSQTSLHHFLPKIIDIESVERLKWYEVLDTALSNSSYDSHVKRRVIALLTKWGLEGDQKAIAILRQHFLAPESLVDSHSRQYLAKSMSQFLTSEERQRLLQTIKDYSANPQITYSLTALTGHPEYTEALDIILDESWDPMLSENYKYGNIEDSFEITFNDPIARINRPDHATQASMAILAGAQWQPAALQHLFEAVSGEWLIPFFSNKIKKAHKGHIMGYAQKYLKPAWQEGERVTLNPIPDKRYWYKRSLIEAENEILQLVEDAEWEESWFHVKQGDKEMLFENGYIHAAKTVGTDADWNFTMTRFPEKEGVIITDIHIHPMAAFNLASKLIMFPSDTDLYSWVALAARARMLYPDAQLQFHIISTFGVTKVSVTDEFYKEIDKLVKKRKIDLKKSDLPKDISKKIKDYREYVDQVQAFVGFKGANKRLKPYFEIKFPISDTIRILE